MSIVISILTILGLSNAGNYFKEPTLYSTTCNVKDYGAKGDGKTNDTSSIQKAINDCLDKGSLAQIIVPSGTYLISALYINKDCNNCAFSINSGATLLVSNDVSKWPSSEDIFSINKVKYFIFEGPGTIDGQGLIWWQKYRDSFRPETIHTHSISHLIIRNLFVKNCPNHCLELYADYTEVYNITIINPPSVLPNSNQESHNTDGIDVHGQPFYVHDSTINTGDDNVALHANDTLIENCNFGSGHGASIGSLGSGIWLTNITVNKINFDGTTQAARIKVDNDAGPGRLWDVTYSNLNMKNVGQIIIVTEYYSSNKNENCQLRVEDITFENINGSQNNTKNDIGQFMCQPSIKCGKINLNNIHISGGKQEWECSNADVIANNVSPQFKGC